MYPDACEERGCAYADGDLTVSVYGGGYHLWEVRQDAFVHFMKVRAL
jgi:hypothetical protein